MTFCEVALASLTFMPEQRNYWKVRLKISHFWNRLSKLESIKFPNSNSFYFNSTSFWINPLCYLTFGVVQKCESKSTVKVLDWIEEKNRREKSKQRLKKSLKKFVSLQKCSVKYQIHLPEIKLCSQSQPIFSVTNTLWRLKKKKRVTLMSEQQNDEF